MKSEPPVSRREFLKRSSAGAAAAVGISALVRESAPVAAQEPGSAFRRQSVVSALGDTLIPSAAGDPGYKNLEWYGITEEVLKGLSGIADADLKLFDESSQQLFGGKTFSELDENQRADYLRLILDGGKFPDPARVKTLQEVFRAVRRRVFTVFYQNFPEHRVPRDGNDVPLLKPGDLRQITNPNTEGLATGWNLNGFLGPLTWEEEEKRRKHFQGVDWVEKPEGDREPAARQFQTQEDFTAALRTAGSKGDPGRPYDVVIVGAGMAGCILAARIAEKGINPANGERLRVALIEWGPYLKGDPQPGYGHPLRRLLFTNVPRENDRRHFETPWGFSRLVGGSSLHFGATAQHPLRADFAHWKNTTGVDWTEAEFRDVIEEVKTMFHVHPYPESELSVGSRLWERAARKLGYSPTQIERARKNCINCEPAVAGCGMCKYDAKQSSLVTYVPIAERNGVEIIPNTKTEKLILEKRGSDWVATGVWAEQDGKKVRFLADKVILSASVNGTPWILYNSGYGPRDMLGKELLVENPNVGRHVDGKLDGPRFSALFPFPLREPNWGMVGAFHFFQGGEQDGYDCLEFREHLTGRQAPDAMASSEFAPEFGWAHKQFMKTRGDQIANLVQFEYLPRNPLEGRIQRDGMHVFTVKEPSYTKRLIEGMMIVRDIYREMGAIRIANLDRQIKELESIQSSPQSFLPTTWQSCSCRAGEDRRDSVVNSRFECHEIRNLFLCDLSTPPRVTLGNPGICMVAHIANLGWRRIVKDHFSRA